MAVWKVYGDPFLSADMTGKSMSIRFKPNRNMVLKALKTWIIIRDSAGTLTFTALCGKIYSDRDGVAGGLIATSINNFDIDDLLQTEDQGVIEPWFEFAELSLNSDTWYHLILNCTGYTYSATQHIAWRKAWPDPIYRTNLPLTFEGLISSPYFLVVLGDDL
jgi:hypothetical protein